MQGFNDLLKTQMILGMGASKNALTGILALNMFDIAIKTFPTWSTWTWCRRRRSGVFLYLGLLGV
jgi:hypothetical protein